MECNKDCRRKKVYAAVAQVVRVRVNITAMVTRKRFFIVKLRKIVISAILSGLSGFFITNVMFLHEKTGKTASPRSIRAEDAMKKIKKPPKKRTTLREDLGKYLLDLSKLVFGSIFLGSILHGELPRVILGAIGFAVAMGLLFIGLNLTKKEKLPPQNNGANGIDEIPPKKE